jgi:serine/threonine protein kinase
MEFCKGGDVEDMVRRAHQLSVDTVRCYLFQMLLALYTSREKLQLRHFDIKLLNFFATNTSSLVQGRRFGVLVGERSHGNLNVGFGEKVFCLPLRLEETDLIKLADFGTSTVGAGSLGDPIGPDQFSTLENTPIEYLLLGSEARQAYSADTFCLGLCFLHLLTGLTTYQPMSFN